MSEIAFHVSPSILDKYMSMLDADQSWEHFYGMSEEPSVSLDEWRDKMLKELVDAVNGVVTPSSPAADLGTCLNEAVDCILLGQRSTRDDVVLQSGQAGHDGTHDMGECVFAVKGENKFMFHAEDVVNLATHVRGMTPQELVSETIQTNMGCVQLYGYPDYYDPKSGIVVDLKTTKNYESGKYANYMQRYVYPYILTMSGKIERYRHFNFLVCKVTGNNKSNPFVELELFNETYTEPMLTIYQKLAEVVGGFVSWYDNMMYRGVCNDRLCGERK